MREFPDLSRLLPHREAIRVAVNLELKDFETEVSDGDEVALMPPFSGG